MPGGVEFGDESVHARPRRPVHRCRYGDAGTEARVVVRTAWPVSMAVRLVIAGSLEEGVQLYTQGSCKLTDFQ